MNKKIQTVSARDTVEIHLPDGRVLSGPRGTSAGEFLGTDYRSNAAPLVAAIVNGDLRELTYPVQMEARLAPVTMADADGARIYRRSLVFLLEAAFEDLFPKKSLSVDHSVSSGVKACQALLSSRK